MKRILFICLLFLTTTGIPQEAANNVCQEFVGLLQKKKLEQAHSYFGEDIKNGFPLETFEQMWGQILGKMGKFKSYAHNCTERDGETFIVYTTCTFKESVFDIKCITDAENKIVSFTMNEVYTCGKEEKKYRNPSYEDPEQFEMIDAEFKSDHFNIPGTLTLPKENDKNVIVIFVHGSGPNDRDAGYGPNKMFRDLAVGLAMNGYSSLRYDKRTYLTEQFRQEDMEDFTIEKEVLDDVQAAIRFLEKHQKTTGKRIYLLGHSLGGMLVQRAALENRSSVEGIITMAGPASRFEDLLPDQYEYLFSLDGTITKQEQAQIDEINQQVERLKNGFDSKTPASELPLNIPAPYWLSLKDYDQITAAKAYDGRILVLNGERDYQVPMTEFEKWKEGLGTNDRIQYRSFEKLNHFFFEGEGKPNPEEYENVSNVPEYVIKTITDWLDAKQK